MKICRLNPAGPVPRGILGLALLLGAASPGCSPEGAGTIKVENPEFVRSKFAGVPAREKASSEKQSKALQSEEEAARKHPKLR